MAEGPMGVAHIDAAEAKKARTESRAALGEGRLDQLTTEQLVVLFSDVTAEIGRRNEAQGRRPYSPGQLQRMLRVVEGGTQASGPGNRPRG